MRICENKTGVYTIQASKGRYTANTANTDNRKHCKRSKHGKHSKPSKRNIANAANTANATVNVNAVLILANTVSTANNKRKKKMRPEINQHLV